MENMLKYQEIDGKIKKIAYKINHSEESQRGKKLGLFLKDAEENLKKMDRRADEISVYVQKLKNTYDVSIADFADLEKGAEQAIDKDELNYLSKKLIDVSRNVGSIEREINVLLKEIDEIFKRYEDLRNKVPTARTQYKNCRSKFDELKKECEPEVNELKAELAELEKVVNPELLETYQRLRKQNIYPVVVPLVGVNQCGGCQMQLAMGAIGQLSEKGFITCENCQRIIYK